MERYICIHGHFYQPPRENPWLEAIEIQDSAYPYHDWNERITAECYAPNSASRILDEQGRITRIVNNYSRISFNFGPTLLAWLQHGSPSTYQAILDADRESRKNYSGHGSAIAQVYNHMILPLANSRDKRTQVIWGIRDFESRFGRAPEGMWLSETAVDLESLEILAEMGIQFTILAPRQARRTRAIGGHAWKDVSGGRIDPSMPYRIRLQSGRLLTLFFYDGPISRAIAFEDLLSQGESVAQRLANAFSEARTWPQLVHIATDGETYGHHRRHADMALAYGLDYIETSKLARLTNYGEYLAKYPPTHEVQIFENSSWSCVHGVERWRGNCGCASGMNPSWNQEWRAPLREALDWLRDHLAPRYQQKAGEIFQDPWAARNDYVHVILDRSPENVERFLGRHARWELQLAERITALQLLELQRHAMLMYTSCGWFFDELSGIETVQVIQYAGRALQLAEELFGDQLEEQFLDRLERAKSNIAEHRDGRLIYEKFVKPAVVDLEKVGAHYAISSLFEDYEDTTSIYCHTVERQQFQLLRQGKTKLALGRSDITSQITGESAHVTFGVLHLGDQNVSGGIRVFRGSDAYEDLASEVSEIFHRGDIPELIRAVDRHFGSGIYSLRLLFRDEQRKIVRVIVEAAMSEAAALYRNFYGQYSTLARFMTDLGIPLPKRFEMAVDFTLNEDLLAALSEDSAARPGAGDQAPDPHRIDRILEEVKRTGVPLDVVTLEFTFRATLERAAANLRANPRELEALQQFDQLAGICPLLPFEVNLWSAQNAYYEVMRAHFAGMQALARGDLAAQDWIATARALGEKLRVWPDGSPEAGP